MNAAVRTLVRPPRSGFEPNLGETGPKVKFRSSDGSAAFLVAGEVVLTLANDPVTTIQVCPVGANPNARPTGEGTPPGLIHDYRGGGLDDQPTNRTVHQAVVYHDIYEGIDLVYRQADGHLEYDFIVAPHTNPALITIEVRGADCLTIDADGSLFIERAGAEVRQHPAHVYQDTARGRRSIWCRYVRRGPNRVGFDIGPTTRTCPWSSTRP